jgi:hypothetical protein
MEQRDEVQLSKLMEVIHYIFSTGGVSFAEGRATISAEGAPAPPGSGPANEGLPPPSGAVEPSDPLALEKMIAGLAVSNLKSIIEKKPGTDEAILAERQRSRILISTFENARMLIEMKKYAQAVMCLEITAAAAPPDNAFVDFSLARARALNGQKNGALKSLTAAAAKGFDRPELIEKEEAFAPLRSTPEFASALEKIRANAAARPPSP